MIRLRKPDADRAEWQESWTDNERLLAHAIGYFDSLVDISVCKRELQNEMLPPGLRLRFLEIINRLVRDRLTISAMQHVQPCCDTALQMIDAMKQLEPGDKLRLMTSWNVAAAFANLNPSIVESIKLFD